MISGNVGCISQIRTPFSGGGGSSVGGGGGRNGNSSNSLTPVSPGNRYLTEDEKKINATIIYNYLRDQRFQHNAICAILGNMDVESTLNPSKQQDDGYAYGLVQWDYSRQYLFNYLDSNGYSRDDLFGQLSCLLQQMAITPEVGDTYWNNQNVPPGYYMSYDSFRASYDLSVEYLTQVFLWCFEKPSIPHTDWRITAANKWDIYFS